MSKKFPNNVLNEDFIINTPERTVRVVGLIDYEPLEKEIDKSIEENGSNEEVTDEVEALKEAKKKLLNKKVQYIDKKGYVDEDGNIWIYCAEGKPKNCNAYPYFWFNEDGEKEFSDPPELIKKIYTVDNMIDMSVYKIIEDTQVNEELYDEDMLNDINSSSSFFVPTIRELDDFLKKIVKYAILQKGIDINGLKSKTDEKYMLPNMKSALQNKTKMSVIYFLTWMNLLGCDFEITVIDNGEDTKNKLKYPLVYRSYKDSVGILKDGQVEDLPDELMIKDKDE